MLVSSLFYFSDYVVSSSLTMHANTAARKEELMQVANVPSGEPNLPPQTGARVQCDGQEPTGTYVTTITF